MPQASFWGGVSLHLRLENISAVFAASVYSFTTTFPTVPVILEQTAWKRYTYRYTGMEYGYQVGARCQVGAGSVKRSTLKIADMFVSTHSFCPKERFRMHLAGQR